ncbi:MAG: enoyl-CoA hydratase-related protein, partial [Bacteroidota bacterium]
MESILFDLTDGVASITLNRPAVYNSFNCDMALSLQHYLKECSTNAKVRAIYLTGAGKAFCAGQDLQEAIDPKGPGLTRIVGEHYNPIIELIREIEKPIVGAVNGVAAGAGANIALACDITLAAESAYFMQAFSKIGLIPDSGGTYILPRIVGRQRATALMMLAEKVPANEAVQMGMIYRAYPDEAFAEA